MDGFMRLTRGVLLLTAGILAGCGDADRLRPATHASAQEAARPDLPYSTVLARLDGGSVTLEDLCAALGGPVQLAEELARQPEAHRDEWLARKARDVAAVEATARRAESAGLADATRVRDALHNARADLAGRAFDERVNRAIEPVTEAEIRGEYQKNQERYLVRGSFRFQHIFIRTLGLEGEAPLNAARARAEAALAAIRAGSEFEAVARQYSEAYGAPGATITETVGGRLNVSIQHALMELEEGEVSDLIQTVYGYFIVRLLNYTPSRTRTLDEVRDSVLRTLEYQKRTLAEDRVYRDLRHDPAIADGVVTRFDIAGAPAAEASAVIFRTGEEAFTEAHYRRLYATASPDVRRTLDSVDLRKSYLESTVFRKAFVNYAMERQGELAAAGPVLEHVRRHALSEEWLDREKARYLAENAPAEEALRAAFDANPAQWMTEPSVSLETAKVEADINEAMDTVEIGRARENARLKALDLLAGVQQEPQQTLAAVAAARFADDECVTVEQADRRPLKSLPASVRTALEHREFAPGLVDRPIPVENAYLITRLTAYTPPESRAFESVRDELKRRLEEERWQERRIALIDELATESAVNVDLPAIQLIRILLDKLSATADAVGRLLQPGGESGPGEARVADRKGTVSGTL